VQGEQKQAVWDIVRREEKLTDEQPPLRQAREDGRRDGHESEISETIWPDIQGEPIKQAAPHPFTGLKISGRRLHFGRRD
jgi:hypothetical protein